MPGPQAPSGLFATAAEAKERHRAPAFAPQPAEICAPLAAAGDVGVLFEDGYEEAVAVDKRLGPMWVSEADAKPMKRYGYEGNGKVVPFSGGFGGCFAKQWGDLSATEKEVLLLTTARRQRSLKEVAALRAPEEAEALVVRAPPQVRPARWLVDNSVRPGKRPLLVCWYSGGFFAEAGKKLLEPLLKAARVWGIKDTLVLHHTNEYGFTGEGYEGWPAYVDRLIYEINQVTDDRPLILFGHSKGCCPAMSVASRLGKRVIKVYLTACMGWKPKHPTPWELEAAKFKETDDQALMAWFSGLNPSDILLRTAAEAKPQEFSDLVKGSRFLTNMLDLMRLQYKFAMFPDMKKKVIDVFPADVTTISPMWDFGSGPEAMHAFSMYTKGKYKNLRVNAGHMDVLSSPDFHSLMMRDMRVYFP